MVDNRDPWPHPWAKFLPESWELVREKLETGDVVLSALPAFNCANTPALAALEKLLTLVASASHVVDRSSKFLPQSPSHLAHQLQNFTNIKMYFIGLTPYAESF
jgi:phospholipid N-methyltransferase